MIDIHLGLRNPYSERWHSLFSRTYALPIQHKHLEINLERNSDIIVLNLRITHRQSHAGIFLNLAILGYSVLFNMYDDRHWDYENNCWS